MAAKQVDQGQYADEGVSRVQTGQPELDRLEIPEDVFCTFTMVHVNHLDLTWYWRFPDTVQMMLETVRWNVELLERHPDARYSHTQVLTLRTVERLDPELFARLTRLARGGRFLFDSGQVVEPDHNLPSGESLVRQLLYGQRYLVSRFGTPAEVLVNSDSFGHARSLPQLLAGAGIGAVMFKRPRQVYRDLPETPFRWRGIDGTEIVALRFINKGSGLPSLSQGHQLPEGTNALQEKVDRNLRVGVRSFIGTHCASDAGGATPYVAPRRGKRYELRYGSPVEYFRAVAQSGAELPVHAGLLGPVYPGCYTSHIAEKENLRRAERELAQLEGLWTLLALGGEAYPMRAISDLWWRLCYLQFHDIVTGTGSPEAHQDSAAHYHELFLQALALRRRAQALVTAHVRVPVDGAVRTVAIANTSAGPWSGVARVDLELPLDRASRGAEEIAPSGELEGPGGERIPYQLVSRRVFQRYVRGEAIFRPAPLAGLELRTYGLRSAPAPTGGTLEVDGSVLSNGLLRVDCSGGGLIGSIVRLRDGRELLHGPAPVHLELWPETDYTIDYGTPMKAWQLGVTDRRDEAALLEGLTVVESGPVRATLRFVHGWGASRFESFVSLYAGEEWVEVRVQADWQEKEVLLRLRVRPAPGSARRITYGIPYGTETATGEETELPVVGWADVSDHERGMALLVADRPGACFREGCIRSSVVRCATGDWDPRTDSGSVGATYRLVPHEGSASAAGVPGMAAAFLHPAAAWQVESDHARGAPYEPPVVVTGGEGVVAGALKVAEDGSGVVVRLVETRGAPAEAVLRIGRRFSVAAVRETDLLERRLRDLQVEGRAVRVELQPYEVKTVLVENMAQIAFRAAADGQGLF